ncbi:GNAT family N-acetyltransferase [Spirosoma taeanense]|uniref:GNAT family N-acetyltransferase n=1 Tax=Spirosoma taeanense TaxID=2735870 RepID=A0A6M5YCT4_9BACT|nr:GNAT family N-acetyltransferase [Spirosoma taeanense]QJW91083.1 GNAT family N-acetyltransferase [Spirosoma taeanense]
MINYTIQRQQNPPYHAIPDFCQQGFFFNEGDHLQQQSNGAFHLLTALNQSTRQAEARCAFFLQPHRAVSPAAAPFGSIEFADSLPDPILDEFLRSLTEAAQSAGAPTLRLVNYPHCYAPKQADRLTDKLIEQGYQLVAADQNFFLSVANHSFESSIAPSQRRRLRKCRQAGFQFEHWQRPNPQEVVTFLQETRQQQGYLLTICPDRLVSLLQEFPEQFPVFVVSDGDIRAALTVAVRVRADILYNFMPASRPDYHRFSPMVMLTDGLFGYCQRQRIRLLDLGVSLDANRQPKPSLMRFKQKLGAQSSPKLVFEKAL